jgi:hypothetical protein
VLDALVAVQPQLLLIGVRAERRPEVGEHVVRIVVEAARPLHRGAAPEVELSPGLRRGAARPARALQHEHIGVRRRGLVGGGRAGASEADDEHVAFMVEGADRIGRHGLDRRHGAHAQDPDTKAASGSEPDQSWPQ